MFRFARLIVDGEARGRLRIGRLAVEAPEVGVR
jgi:hypothetical protein